MKPDISWLQDTGILKKTKGDELKAPNPRPLAKLKINQPLSIHQLASAFLLEVSGIVISILAFSVELLLRKKSKAKGSKKQVTWVTSTRHIMRGRQGDISPKGRILL